LIMEPRRKSRRRGSLSAWLLFALPVLLMLMFVGVNAQYMNFSRATQERVTDASALAAAQVMVDDAMLMGNPTNIANLEAVAAMQAQQYASYNPLANVALSYGAADIAFVQIANPLNSSLMLVQSVQVTGQRTSANNNPVPLFGGGLFSTGAVDVVTRSKATLDHGIAGFRPVFHQNVPLAPIALLQMDWQTQVETGYSPPPLPTYTVTLGTPTASFLQIGTSSDADLATQLTAGITPAQLAGAPFNGQFAANGANPLSVPTFAVMNPADLSAALTALQTSSAKRAWPLFSAAGMGNTTVVGFVAARIQTVTTNKDGSLTLTLVPTFMGEPSALTGPTQPINPYLCRVHLTN
jgi:hypothetical protein